VNKKNRRLVENTEATYEMLGNISISVLCTSNFGGDLPPVPQSLRTAQRNQCNTLLMSHISWSPVEITEKFQRLNSRFCQPICKEQNLWDPDIGRRRKYKMTAVKPEVVISHVLQQINTRFTLLNPGIRGCPTRWSHRRRRSTSADTENARWRQPNRQ
jgi:hypothetical protein